MKNKPVNKKSLAYKIFNHKITEEVVVLLLGILLVIMGLVVLPDILKDSEDRLFYLGAGLLPGLFLAGISLKSLVLKIKKH